MTRTFLAGADLVLPDRVAAGRSLVLEDDRIAAVIDRAPASGAAERRVDVTGHLIVPGFIDVHVHGALGVDTLDGDGAIASIARLLPRWGVTAFCPTTVACDPAVLAVCLAEVGRLRGAGPGEGARVLPAHLESNFINPEYAGAQPREWVRAPVGRAGSEAGFEAGSEAGSKDPALHQDPVLRTIDRYRADVGIVTLAPEIAGGLDLVRRFAAAGVRVSLGHSGATYEEAMAAIAAGARHATHLYNRMRPMTHHDPGLVGAILTSGEVAAEIICDGHHVHPAIVQTTIAAKGASEVMAITDGTAGSGLPRGARACLGGRAIVVDEVARLEDGTTAGSVLTMDRAFAFLVGTCGADFVQAAAMCATTPARALGLDGYGAIAPGFTADFTVLDAQLRVQSTWIAGRRIWPS